MTTDFLGPRFMAYATLWCNNLDEAETMLTAAVEAATEAIAEQFLRHGFDDPKMRVVFAEEPALYGSPQGVQLRCRFGVFEAREIQ